MIITTTMISARTSRSKGLDCSGYEVVYLSDYGGLIQQLYQEIGSLYKEPRMGSGLYQNYLNKTGYKLYPGDIGFDDGHTWIILGQCKDMVR